MIFRLAAVLSPPAAADLLPALSHRDAQVRAAFFCVVLARREGAGKPLARGRSVTVLKL
jgi:hypothetical protein